MLVLLYLSGALAQAAGSIGLAWAFWLATRRASAARGLLTPSACFGLACAAESLALAVASVFGFLAPFFLQGLFVAKLLLFAAMLARGRRRAEMLRWAVARPLFVLWAALLLFSVSLPTSCYDTLVAHFSIPRLFLENLGFPDRRDYEYLYALPMGAHMWFLPGLAMGLDGAANAVAPVFSLACLVLIEEAWGKKIAFWSVLLLMSMPEFLRVSMDPMVDAPSVFYALLGLSMLRGFRPFPKMNEFPAHLLLAGIFWAMLVSIKQTLVGFLFVWAALLLWNLKARRVRLWQAAMMILLSLVVGGIWYFRVWASSGSPLFPYFLPAEAQPLIPQEYMPPERSFTTAGLLDYLRIVFFESRWMLSLGPWPAILLPVLAFLSLRKGSRSLRLALALFFMGFVLTFYFTPFKNRYFLPYALALLPWMAAFVGRRARPMKWLLAATAALGLLSFLPYFAQPAAVAAKGLDRKAFYALKFGNFAAFDRVNGLPPGRVLFVASPVYWLEREHVFSVYSESFVDYTRINGAEEFAQRLKALDVRYVVYDHGLVSYMAAHPDPYYSAKRYCAKRCAGILEGFTVLSGVRTLWDEKGVRVMELP